MQLGTRVALAVSVLVLIVAFAGVSARPYAQPETPETWVSPATEHEWERFAEFERRILRGEELTPAEKEEYIDLEARVYSGRNGGDHLDNQGGPDGFNYIYMDNVAPDTCTYDWIELRGDPAATWIGGLTHFTSIDDGYSREKVYIGFPFPFYGATYDCVRVMTNGFLNFTNTTQSLSNACLPASVVSAPMIALYWDDLHLYYGGQTDTICVGYRNFGNYFVIEFDGIGYYSSSCRNVPLKFQAILFPSGSIKLQYNSIPVPASCANSQTIGIQQNGTAGSAALNYVCNTTGIPVADGRAIWFFQVTGIPRPCTNLQASVSGNNVTLTWTDPTLDTQGNPITLDGVEVWLGQAGSGTLLSTVNPGVQTYTHVGAPDGNLTYSVRPVNAPYYGTPVSVSAIVGTPSYVNDFNTNSGNWVADPPNGWEWGPPWGVANLIPHSPPNVWGTMLSGNYDNDACWHLDLNMGLAVISPAASIEFWHWFYSGATYDGCNFKVSVDGGATWEVVIPSQGGYNLAALGTGSCMSGEPAWCGTTPYTWQYCVIPLGQYLGQVPILRFDFATNSTTNSYPGFCFDDMIIWGLAAQDGIPQPCTNVTGSYVAPNVVITWTDPTQDTHGNPITVDNVEVWLGQATVGTLLGTVLPGVQTFTHLNAPTGIQTYTVRPYRNPYYGAATSTAPITVGTPGYQNDFETNDGGWVADPPTGGWEWGQATVPSTFQAHSGTNVWGTVLNANYPPSACFSLTLDAGLVVTSPTATFEFWRWFDTEASYDGCNLLASVDNGITWTILQPSTGGYTGTTNTVNTCNPSQPVWTGHNDGRWVYVIVPIGQYLGQMPIFRFVFGCDPSVHYPGFFFDDMIIWGASQQSGIPRAVTNLSGQYSDGNTILTWTDPTLDTQGNPLTLTNVQVWLGQAGTGTLLGTVNPGVQTFTHVGAPIGLQTYSVRAYNNPYYGAPASTMVLVGTPGYYCNFDTTDGGWVATPETGGWAWGEPTYASAPAPHSGTGYWGTGLHGDYAASACYQLDLNSGMVVTTPTATVEFWYRYRSQLNYDGCNFKASVDNGVTWTTLTPSEGTYTSTALNSATACIPSEPAWSGTTQTEWQHAVIPIGQFEGQAPILRFSFGANSSTQYTGFFLDDLIIWGMENPVGMPRPCTNFTASYVAPNVVLTWTDPTLDTQGNPLTLNVVQVWFGSAGTGSLLGVVQPGVQTYTHTGVPSGIHTYSIRPYADPYYGAPSSDTVMAGSPSYVNDFETNDGGWVPNPPTGGWEWGTPTVPTTLTPHSGTKVWGTVLNANYPASACFTLDLDLDLVVQSPSATVEFWRWYDTEASYDGCNFHVSVDDGATWTLVQPSTGGYTGTTNTVNTCNPSQAAWTGHNGGTWTYVVIPIGQFVGQTPIFRFVFGSDPSVHYPGFFFDDMIIWGLRPASGITGTVRSFSPNAPIAGAQVWASGVPDTAVTDDAGYYVLGCDPGTYSVTFHHPNYCDTTYTGVVVVSGEQTQRSAVLRQPNAQISATSITMNAYTGQQVDTTFTIGNQGGQCPLKFWISDSAAWLTVTPDSGTIAPYQSATITVTANAASLGIGDYTTNIRVVYNAAGTPRVIRCDLLVTSSADDPNSIPTEFALYQNFPNPFNASTTLRFDVPQNGHVQIVLFNIAGQEVARPVDGVYAPGRYRLLFNASDLPSGMYFVKMNATGYERIGKMMLLK